MLQIGMLQICMAVKATVEVLTSCNGLATHSLDTSIASTPSTLDTYRAWSHLDTSLDTTSTLPRHYLDTSLDSLDTSTARARFRDVE